MKRARGIALEPVRYRGSITRSLRLVAVIVTRLVIRVATIGIGITAMAHCEPRDRHQRTANQGNKGLFQGRPPHSKLLRFRYCASERLLHKCRLPPHSMGVRAAFHMHATSHTD